MLTAERDTTVAIRERVLFRTLEKDLFSTSCKAKGKGQALDTSQCNFM